jgi:hypothetical protein
MNEKRPAPPTTELDYSRGVILLDEDPAEALEFIGAT